MTANQTGRRSAFAYGVLGSAAAVLELPLDTLLSTLADARCALRRTLDPPAPVEGHHGCLEEVR